MLTKEIYKNKILANVVQVNDLKEIEISSRSWCIVDIPYFGYQSLLIEQLLIYHSCAA